MSVFERIDGVPRLVHFLPVIADPRVTVFHVLLGLSVLSYIAVVAHRPLAPDLSLAPPDARPLPGYEEWDEAHEASPSENPLLEGVPPPASLAPVARPAPIPEPDDDDIPLRLLRNSPSRDPEPAAPEETDALLDGFDGPIAIMAKSNTGGPRQAALEAYRFFQDPSRYDGGSYPENDMEALQLTFTPVLFLLLAIIGGSLALALGGLAGYHWYLMIGSRQRLPGAWRPDHILTRPERTRLRREAREINVYDLGWARNVRQVMVGDATLPAASWGEWARDVARAAWPLTPPRMQKYARGHVFAHDRDALRDLKALTREVRLGLGAEAERRDSDTTVSADSDRVPPYRRYE
ncbi:vacuole protein [Trichosporon asahii var. asahii CBS 2479]|uniref:Vacuole protein n=1 Tax=Trichosporon asahii var. asahii (strain ATCC 90039 / CBS 2479 / JCM 2466 / KCTC 7840 / NBRC 103889/ NCYC 2677 / UAMH 7654) TaxID=1186058 RepID=J5R5U2_TRIAS|nr:vacuole protein [Trichosporon asahii var. asahii CBS 2479]EJT50853.1 vacuole protein [Trichosporon asahii var. asahii CBS 2479]